ncbi:MAG TPA: MarR family transcriptional regulator [Actinospica sp.]|nr:MarR family transcriptional regulator [Actinospica sp.]
MTQADRIAEFERDVAARTGFAVKRAEQALMAAKASVLRAFDLTVPQYTALLALSYVPGLSGAQLARLGAVTPQNMSTILTNLEAKGLIRREASEIHQRVFVVRLTEHGAKLTREADAAAREVERRLDAALGEQDRTALRALLETATAALGAVPPPGGTQP